MYPNVTAMQSQGMNFKSMLMNENINQVTMISISTAPTLERNGTYKTISISDQLHVARLKMFEIALIGKVIL